MVRNIFLAIICVLGIVISTQAETVGDIDGDDQVGLKESIYSLQVVAGLKPVNVEQVTLMLK